MKSNSFLRNRKALTALLLCTGFVATQPFSVMAEEIVTAVQTVQQQKQSVSGTIKDPAGEPVIGASILEKGTTNGTITDFDGNFTLNVAPGATLVISYIGYKNQEMKVIPGKSLNIILQEDTETLEEVVVVGYGVQKKSDVTGSVTSVGKERLGKLPVTNVLQAVQGAAAGVTITQTSSIPGDAPDALVRGQNSINANSGPYIVVDGVPISKSGGTLNDINPNDIESMEILKDASATAIYGTNGANGVILITTKRGTSGKPTIRYNGYFGVEDFSHKLDFCDGSQITQRYRDYVSQNPGETMYNDYVKNAYEAENQSTSQFGRHQIVVELLVMSGYSSRTSREHGNSSEACIIPPLYQLVEDVIGSDSPIVGSFKTCPSFTNLKLVSQTPQNDGRTITVAFDPFCNQFVPDMGERLTSAPIVIVTPFVRQFVHY